MPFAQVTEDQNGQKVLTPITESTSTTAADALALAENALPLDGSKVMTGNLAIQNTAPNMKLVDQALELGVAPEEANYTNYGIVDKNGNNIAIVQSIMQPDGVNVAGLHVFNRNGTNGSIINAHVGVRISQDGQTVYGTTSNPSYATAPDNAIMTKKVVADNYLAKAGGEMTGRIDIKSTFLEDESPVNTYNWIMRFLDKNNGYSGGMDFGILVGGEYDCSLWRVRQVNGVDKSSTLRLCIDDDGVPFATFSHPRPDNYGNDGVTAKAMKDWAARMVTATSGAVQKIIHVGGENASDTANLNAGRGESADMPFASLIAALLWVAHTFVMGDIGIQIQLHSDVTVGRADLSLSSGAYVQIASDATKRTINITDMFRLLNGNLAFGGVKINSSVPHVLISSDGMQGYPLVRFTAVDFSGSAPDGVVQASHGGRVVVWGAQTGDIAGKKYNCANGGMLIGASRVPGTEAGTVDADSKAIG